MSEAAASGILRGTTITLDAPVPVLDGRRVRILIESEDEKQLTAEEQRQLWVLWTKTGPQGPIEDDGAPEFP
jgi:predicted thioesterase